MKNTEKIARIEFAKQLIKYRDTAGISQNVLAQGLNKQQPYIAKIERFKHSVGLDLLVEISTYFGVKYYQMADPDFTIPSKEELIHSIEEYHKLTDTDTSYLSKRSPNYAKNMDKYLQTAYLKESKTSKEIAKDFMDLYQQEIPASKVSDILSRSPRKELLDIIKPESGRGNKYRLK